MGPPSRPDRGTKPPMIEIDRRPSMRSSKRQTQVIEAAYLHQADAYRRQRSATGEDPVLLLITVSFNSSCASDELSRPKVASLFRYWDRLYRHLCSEALGAKFNKPHKRSLQSLTYAFLTFPGPTEAKGMQGGRV